MAYKRRIGATRSRPAEEPVEKDEESWGEWAKRSYSRAWYILICLVIDSFVLLELAEGNGPGSWGITAIVLLVLIMVQSLVYLKLWGKGGVWYRN